MNNIFLRLCFVILLCWGCSNKPDKQEGSEEEKKEDSNNNEIGAGNNDSYYSLDSNKVVFFLAKHNGLQDFAVSVFNFYKKRNYQPVWIKDSELVPAAQLLIAKLENAEEEGLNPSFYKGKELRAIFNEVQKKNSPPDSLMKELEVLLTGEFCKFAADMNSGATRAERENLKWFYKTKSPVYTDVMVEVIKDRGGEDPFLRLEPLHPEYHQLKILLRKYRDFEKKGGWPMLTGFKVLKLGDESVHVLKIRERLSITGELKTSAANFYNPKIFDRSLEEGVKTFQAGHGLKPDGVVGGVTLRTINISVAERIKQIISNMERWRLVPQSFSDRFILVNVPEFKFYLYDGGKLSFDMRVVVGEEFNATPLFNDTLKYIVFSPYWNVPKSIALKENLPEIFQDNSVLNRQGFEAVRLDGPTTATVVPFYSVPWRQYATEENFRYFLRQKPGPKNPLGSIKFLFPNKHNVYFHDTPFGKLFGTEARGYSHGCIRLEEPVKLAEYLLNSTKQRWTKPQIEEAMHRESELHLQIEKPIPVFILYFTAWVDKNGLPQFRQDVYGYDELLSELIKGNSIKKLLEEKESKKAAKEKEQLEKMQNRIRERLQREREQRELKEQEEKENQQKDQEMMPPQKPEEEKPKPDSSQKSLLRRILGF